MSTMLTNVQKQEIINYVKERFTTSRDLGKCYKNYTMFDENSGYSEQMKIIKVTSAEYITTFPTLGHWLNSCNVNHREIDSFISCNSYYSHQSIIEKQIVLNCHKYWIANNNIVLGTDAGEQFLKNNKNEIDTYIKNLMEEIKLIQTNTI